MRKVVHFRSTSLLLAAGFALAFAPLAQSAPAKAGTTKAIVPADDTATRDRLLAQGATLVVERGEFQIYQLPEALARSSSIGAATIRDDFNHILMNRASVDTRRPAPRSVGKYAALAPKKGLKLVQFAAQPEQSDLDALTATGTLIVHAVPQNAYIVWAPDDEVGEALNMSQQSDKSLLQFVADYLPEYAIPPHLDSALDGAEPIRVTIQLYRYKGTCSGRTLNDDIKAIHDGSSKIIHSGETVLDGLYENIRVEATPAQILQFSTLPGVVTIEHYQEPEALCERQALTMAHVWNITSTGPTLSTGYLGWLTARGFPNTPNSYPNVCVVDDGVDSGNAANPEVNEFRVLNNAANASRLMFSQMPFGVWGVPSGTRGHGHINASIVGGYNNGTGAANEETPEGFNYGLGISPYGRMSNVKFLNPTGHNGASDAVMVNGYYMAGADVSTNSWGVHHSAGMYGASAQSFDSLTRDASTAFSGTNEMLFVFAAGNDGVEGPNTPGTAKNVLTVGATENHNQPDAAIVVEDGCGIPSTGGDNFQDIIDFSSRGPCDDLRIKPDIVAPGTFVYGSHPVTGFTGASVCGGPSTNEYPPGSAYTWSSGTSHATPAVAGYVSLIANYLERQYGFYPVQDGHGRSALNGLYPSAALLKAYVIHSGTYLTGVGAGGNLPSNSQGYGLADMSNGFDTGAPRFFNNQDTVLTTVGTNFTVTGIIRNSTEPFRCALVWTDPPGPTSGNAFVNNLDLQVIVNSTTYRGNVFTGGTSVTGGTADTRNNVEAVFLNPQPAASVSVRVIATSLAGDGAPGTGDATDQNFALVVYNLSQDTLQVTPGGRLNTVGFQGGPFTPTSKVYTLTNTGTTPLNWTSSDNQPFLFTSNPGGTLAAGASANVTVTMNTGVLSLPVGRTTGIVTFTNTTAGIATNRRVEIDALDPLAITPSSLVQSSGTEGGPFTPGAATYTLTNNGLSSINWTASDNQTWIDTSPSGGTIAAGSSVVVTSTFNSAASNLQPGIYNGTVTFSNTTHSTVQTRPVELFVDGCVSPPFVENFELGRLRPGWTLSGTNNPRTFVTSSYGAHGGIFHMIMDTDPPNTLSRNEATLCLDLLGYTNVDLRYWQKEFDDEDHAPPPVFIGGGNFDCVAMSADQGVTWYTLTSLTGANSTSGYTEKMVDLDSAIAAVGIEYNDSFLIRFNHFDESIVGSDGMAFDDISITGDAPTGLTVFPTSPFIATGFNGGPVMPECRTYTVMNFGASNIDWAVTAGNTWFTYSPQTGTLAPGAEVEVEVCLNASTHCLTPGNRIGILDFQDFTNFLAVHRQVFFTMNAGTDCNANGISDFEDINGEFGEPQDECEDAEYVTTGISYFGNTLLATDVGGHTCDGSFAAPEMWLRYKPVSNGTLTVSSCHPGTDYETVLTVHPGDVCPVLVQLACSGDSGTVCGLDNRFASVSRAVVAGTEYLICIAGKNGDAGNFEVTLSGPAGQLAPPLSTDTNNNDIPDECETVPDHDNDGKPDLCEKTAIGELMGSIYTNGLLSDSDGDGLTDGQEKPCDCYSIVAVLAQSNPRLWDTDSDGWGDGLEVKFPATFPNGPLVGDFSFPDSDNDGLPNTLDPFDASPDGDGDLFSDVYEVVHGTNPSSNASTPNLGDVNGDGNFDVADVAMSADSNLGLAVMTASWNSDANLDGIIDLVDVATLADLNLGLTIAGP